MSKLDELFNIEEFNIIQDNECYYFFRALNMADNNDIEQGITTDEDGKIATIRTDRERYDGNPKYSEASEISLEEIFDHIKMHYRKDTNCISFTSNANIAINYGRASYKDRYIIAKVLKKEFGDKIVQAGQYMLQELSKKIEQELEILDEEQRQEILEKFEEIENSMGSEELKEIIEKRYTANKDELTPSKSHLRNGIVYRAPNARIANYQALNEGQLLELNKIYAKLAILENYKRLKHVIPHSSNSSLRSTIGNAFSSTEIIHYGKLAQENIVEAPKEVIDLFGLIQQIDGIDKEKVESLKVALITAVQNGAEISNLEEINANVRDDISIEEMYELTNGLVAYGSADSIVKNVFYLSKSRRNAILLSNILNETLGNNPEYQDIIQYIKENGFIIEPEIISRRSGKGVKLSETVNLAVDDEELIDEVKSLSLEELEEVLLNGGLSDAQGIISRNFGKKIADKSIEKSRYYAEAIFSKYNWQNIGIEEFKLAEKSEFVKRIQERNVVDLYENLKQAGIEEKQIPTILLNIVTRQGLYEQYENGNLEQLLNTKQDILQENIDIELVERFLGYYDVEHTDIKLKDYQQRAIDNIDRIFENKRFAQVVLPTGAGKSFVALIHMSRYAKEHPDEKMLYLAPNDEILDQIKKYIIKYVHGNKNTVGKSEDEIIAEVFPNLQFETYTGLHSKRGQEIKKTQYGRIFLDETHRTGAKEWEKDVDQLLENQNENVRVLGLTATPERDVDGRDMAEATAKKMGYTDEEIKQRKYLASNMTLENAIRMGYVVNPKLVYCKYDLISSGKMEELKAKIEEIEDESKRNEELQKYSQLLENLNREVDSEIGVEARKQLEEEARKNLDNGLGKEIILKQNVKKGGKYIVFIPVTDQGDIEDDEGNKIGTKTGEDKVKAYQDYLKKVFEGTDINPSLYSLLGSYDKDKNKSELEGFEDNSSDDTKFLVVMNKANEGLHISGITGVIWFRALDENSKILYLQQLGRAIYPIDSDNPISDEERPTIIDLANNTLTVKMEKDLENIEPIDDLEGLIIIKEWIENHGGMYPDGNSSDNQQKHYYAFLRRIQSKYEKYVDGNFDGLDDGEIENIKSIIELAFEIDLWGVDLPPISNIKEKKNDFAPFAIEGVLRNYVELDEDIDEIIMMSQALKNALEIEKWCKENFENKKIYEKRLPSKVAKDEKERRLGQKLSTIRQKILKKYEGISIEDIEDEEDKKIIEIISRLDEEYGLDIALKNALEIEEWCKEHFGDKKIYERRLPSSTAKNEYEKSLGKKLSFLKSKIKQYDGIEVENIESKVDREIVEIITRLDKEYGLSETLKNALEIEAWCEENYGDKKIYERRLPFKSAKDKLEKKLGGNLSYLRRKLKQYEGLELEDIENDEDRKIVEIIKRLDEEYGLGETLKNALEIEEWCQEHFGDKKIYERRLPSSNAKNEYEKKLGIKLVSIRQKLKKYDGILIEDIEDNEDIQTLLIIARLDEEYGLDTYLKNALAIENWCRENYEDKKIYERRLPNANSKDECEADLGQKLAIIRSRKLKQYEGIEVDNIESKVDREIAKIVISLDKDYGLGESLKNALEIEEWCEEKYGDKEIYERNLPNSKSKDEKEYQLGRKLGTLRTKLKKYKGMPIEKIENEEDRKIAEIISRLYEKFGLGESLKNALEIEAWCRRNFENKAIRERRLPLSTSKDEYEKKLFVKLNGIRYRKIKQYEGIEIDDIEDEEDKQIVEIIARLDREYNYRKIKAESVGMAGFDVGIGDVAKFDEGERVLESAIEKIQEGGIKSSE